MSLHTMQTPFALEADARSDAPRPSSLPSRICLTRNIREFADFWPRTGRIGIARCYPFQCADLLELACETLVKARNIEPLFVAILGPQDQPLALLPLGIENHKAYSRVIKSVKILTFLDGGLSDYNAPIVFPGVMEWDLATVRAIWKRLGRLLPKYDIAILDKMPERIGDLPNPLWLLKTEKLNESGHAVSLDGDWEDIAGRFPTRHSWRTKRFHALGPITYQIARTPGEYDLFLQVLIRQKRQRYPNALYRSGYIEYFKQAKRLLFPSGPVCLFVLRIGDTIVSTNFGILFGRRFIGQYVTSEGGKWEAHSPGHLGWQKCIEWCFGNEVQVYDFGIGDEPYKNAYCDITISLYKSIFVSTIKGYAAFHLKNLEDRARTRKIAGFEEMKQAEELCRDYTTVNKSLSRALRSVRLWPSLRHIHIAGMIAMRVLRDRLGSR